MPTADVTGGKRTGGVAGYIASRKTVVQNCYSSGKVTGTECVGGVVGLADLESGPVKNCVALPQGNATRAQVAAILQRYIEGITNKIA